MNNAMQRNVTNYAMLNEDKRSSYAIYLKWQLRVP